MVTVPGGLVLFGVLVSFFLLNVFLLHLSLVCLIACVQLFLCYFLAGVCESVMVLGLAMY